MSLTLIAATLACSGCSSLGASPAAPAPAARPPSPLARAQATHEYPSPPPAPQRSSDSSSSAVGAVRAFARAYINWNASTVAAQMRQLAAQSIGQARSAMQLAAAQVAGDYELRRGGIANHGTVEAIAPLAGRAEQFAVVTRELTTASLTSAYQGLRPAWHVTVAVARRIAPGQWVVSGWQAET